MNLRIKVRRAVMRIQNVRPNMKPKLSTTLALLLILFTLSACRKGEISSEFLRIAKIKSLSFTPTSQTDNSRIQPLIQHGGYTYRLGEWKDKWSVARDRNCLVYRGGAAKSDSEHVMFVIVWSNSQGRVVFSEIGHNRSGNYPSGLTSSP